MSIEDLSLGINGQELEADQSHPSSTEIKNGETKIPVPHTYSRCGA
jgi:hypothetical protein